MKFKTFLTLQAILLGAFGLGTIFMAPLVWSLYGLSVVGDAVFMMRFLGCLMFGNAILSWYFREVTDEIALRAIVGHGLVSWLPTLVVMVIAQLDGTYNALGWSNVALCVLFSFGWVYFGFIKRDYS